MTLSSLRNVLNNLSQPLQLSQAIFWRSVRRLGLVPTDDTLSDQAKDRIAPFDEYPFCEVCGNSEATERLIAKDGSRIVACDRCGLWFTSPRIEEQAWTEWLKSSTERSEEFTENRLKYGMALSSNTKYALPDWYERRIKAENSIIDEVEEHLDGVTQRIHDVGCGVGFLLRAAQGRGIEATGNELNTYACQVMRERLGLAVYNDSLPYLDLEPATLDAVVMHDYIEHSYHPLKDLEASYKFLRPGGILFVTTFHIDCRTFYRLLGDWNMLCWNHTFHFSTETLSNTIVEAGFNILSTKTGYEDDLITIVAKK